MFANTVIDEIIAVAREIKVEPAALLAVAEVESGGKPFAVVAGRQEPLIRFEGHYFDRRLSPAVRKTARERGLASPLAGAVPNPKSQPARWKLLARAAEIDAKAAHESVSWGIGQVMGAHWAWLGFASVDALVAEARSGVAGQVRLMARYIEKAGLRAALDRRDWEAFARGYNGPAYRKFGYHTKIAAAYRRHATHMRSHPASAVSESPEASLPPVLPPASVTGAEPGEPSRHAPKAIPVAPPALPKTRGLRRILSGLLSRFR